MSTTELSAVPTLTPPPTQRLIALDAFRGITIAGMILVNNPGSWKYVYGPLRHADWNGWTPTDLVFPFFLFIVGVALAFSFKRRFEQGVARTKLFAQVVRRSLILILLGVIMAAFPDYDLLNAVRDGKSNASPVLVALSLFRLAAPYILFIVGLLFLYADEPLFRFTPSRAVLVRKIVALVLFVGAIAYFWLDYTYFENRKLRVPGVLQRIGLCYFFAALIVMWCNTWGRAAIGVLLLIGYWVLVTCVQTPDWYHPSVKDPIGLLHDWIDTRVLGVHLYSERPDPEGLLSTLPAIATVLAGVLTGHWLQSQREKINKLIGLFVAANVVLLIGLWVGCFFPINKKIWTPSYVLATAGVALNCLAFCYWLIDLKGHRKWAWPFVVFGSNAIVVYVAASMTAKILAITKLADGQTTVKGWLYEHLCVSWAGPFNQPLPATLKWYYDNLFAPWGGPPLGSLAYPILLNLFWLIPMYVLYRLKIFVKI